MVFRRLSKRHLMKQILQNQLCLMQLTLFDDLESDESIDKLVLCITMTRMCLKYAE